jgi:hypothetical protein
MPKNVQAEITYRRAHSAPLFGPERALPTECSQESGKVLAISRVPHFQQETGLPKVVRGPRSCSLQPVGDAGAYASEVKRALIAGEKLRESADDLNSIFARVQATIAKLGLGVSGSIELYSDDHGRHQRLAYEKHLGGWGLNLHSRQLGGEWKTTPIIHASRTVRRLALKKIPELIHELVCCAESEASEIDNDIQGVVAILDLIDAKGAK